MYIRNLWLLVDYQSEVMNMILYTLSSSLIMIISWRKAFDFKNLNIFMPFWTFWREHCMVDYAKNVNIRYVIATTLNNVIINKTKVLLPQTYVTLADFGYPVLAFWFYCSQN